MGQRPEVRVWRIEKFLVKAWPKELYGKFHKGDSYIVLYWEKSVGDGARRTAPGAFIVATCSQDLSKFYCKLKVNPFSFSFLPSTAHQ